jgi:single-stranded-DNA-specific exonuclease
MELFNEIEQLAPFGMGNPAPLFVTKGISIKQIYGIGKEKKHLKLHIEASDNTIIEGLAFNQGENIDELKTASNIDLIYSIDKNEYMGQEKVQINIRDYDLANNKEAEIAVQENFLEKDGQLVLNRDILVKLYIKLKNNAKIENPFLYAIKDEKVRNILKIFEEMGIIKICGGNEPFIIKLNEVKDKLDLNSSLRYRVYSSPKLGGKD